VFALHCDCTEPAQAPLGPMAAPMHWAHASPGDENFPPTQNSFAHVAVHGPLVGLHAQLRRYDPKSCAPVGCACTQHESSQTALLVTDPVSAAQHAVSALGHVDKVVA
jgi:hypothetical protein